MDSAVPHYLPRIAARSSPPNAPAKDGGCLVTIDAMGCQKEIAHSGALEGGIKGCFDTGR